MRRNFLQGIGLFGLGKTLPLSDTELQTGGGNLGRPDSPDTVFYKSETNEFRFLNVIGKVHYKFADLGELLAIRKLTDETNPGTFINAYVQFANTCKSIADNSLKSGFKVSARDAYMRASSYYYAALDFLDEAGQADKFLQYFKMHRDCWKAGAQLMDFSYEEFDIPYEQTTIKGFFFGHKNDKVKRPLLIFNNGSDGSIVDCWTMGGAGAFERGYNVVTFDGPGQGSSLFEKNLFFRYDWEKVVSPVVDAVIKRKDVDPKRIVLLGLSQGGYWVPRAAAFEKRIHTMIADPGVVNVSTSWMANLPQPLVSLLQSGNKAQFNGYLAEGFKQSPATAALYNFRARPYGFDNPFDAYTAVQKYQLNDVAGNISCNVIITSPEKEQFWPGQSQQLFDMIKSPKQQIPFTTAQGADYHCEPKARVLWEQQVFDSIRF